MAFESLHDIAKQSRKSRGRASGTPRALISITQAYYKERETTVLTFRLTAEAMEKARFKQGDRADIAYDKENNLWQISAIPSAARNVGYAVSSSSKTGVGQIRLTYYDGMPVIADKKTRKARGFSDDEKVEFSLGQVIFSIKNVECNETTKEGNNEESSTDEMTDKTKSSKSWDF